MTAARRQAVIQAFGPGRVTLVGEHTDYNRGLALAFAIAQGVTVEATPASGSIIEVVAADLGEEDSFAVARPGAASGWRAFVRGTVAELVAAGHPPPGARLRISATLPRESGLSSSAALETALCLALLALAAPGEPPDRLTLARLCSRVENRHAGVATGLLDQITSLYGVADAAVRIDFALLGIEEVPLHLRGWTLAVVDSGERRVLGDSQYGTRREECARACAALGVASLRDADPGAARGLPAPLDRRARHVLEENARVDDAVAALRAGDLPALAAAINGSHRSLRDLYDASTAAVEATVGGLLAAGAAAARMIGGGFGGHVLGLFPPGVAPPAGAVTVTPSPGARLLDGSR